MASMDQSSKGQAALDMLRAQGPEGAFAEGGLLAEGGELAGIESTGLASGAATMMAGGGMGEIAGATFGAGAMGAAAMVALPITAAVLGAHEYEAQHQANMAVVGQIGGTQAHAMATRAQRYGFGLTQMFGMGSGAAEQLFTGTTDLGLQGAQRQSALDMAVSTFNTVGMSVTDSINAISVALKAGNANFAALGSTLQNVSDSAASAGINTEMARQNFVQAIQTNAALGLSGASNYTISAMQTNMESQLGQVGAGGSFGMVAGPEQAGALGLSLTQYDISVNNPNTGYLTAAAGQTAVQNKVLLPGILANQPKDIKQLAYNTVGNQNASSSAFATSMINGGIVNNQNIAGWLQQFGVTPASSMDGMWAQAAQIVSGNPYSAAQGTAVTSALQKHQGNLNTATPSAAGRGATGRGNAYNPPSAGSEEALQSIKNMIGRNGQGLGQAKNLAELYEATSNFTGASDESITEGGKTMGYFQALSNKAFQADIEKGQGTINLASGKSESVKSFLKGKTLPNLSSSTGTPTGKGSGTVTISLGPGVANLFGISATGDATLQPPTQTPTASQLGGSMYGGS